MSYLKRLEIVGVAEDEKPGNYMKRVEVVEVLDSEGNSWEPVPGPDPWEDMVVTIPSKYSNLNNYVVGSEVFAHVAEFSGGTENNIYRYRWSYQAADSDTWVQEGWTSYNNNSVLETSYTIPPEAEGGKVRFQSQARDSSVEPVNSANSYTSPKDVEWKPMELVSNPGISGDVFAGEYLTGTKAVYAHGVPPVEVQSQIQVSPDGTSSWSGVDAWGTADNGQHRINNDEVGKYFRVAGRGIDQSENAISQADTLMSFSEVVGPAGQYSIGTVTGQVDGEAYDPDVEVINVIPGQSNVLTVSRSGNSPNINYTWTVRQGDVRITPQGAMCTIVHQSEPPQGVQVQCDLIDNYSSDDNPSIRFAFFVNE